MSQVKILNDHLIPNITDIIMNYNMSKKEDIEHLKFKYHKKIKKEFRRRLNYENILKHHRNNFRKTKFVKCSLCTDYAILYEYFGKYETREQKHYCKFCINYFN
jgi:hypothetical protein